MDCAVARRLDSLWVNFFVAGGAYLLFIVAYLLLHGGGFSYFVTFGDMFSDKAALPTGFHVLGNSSGYDGQFYYRLALNPFTTEKRGYGVTFDIPPYRQQRILYPLLVWALSLGGRFAVPFMMVAVNYIALCLIAVVGGVYARSIGRSTCWGLVLALYPGFIITLSRDLAEIIAVLLVLSGLLLFRRGRHGLAALAFSLGVLAKETTLLAAFAVLVSLAFGFFKVKSEGNARWSLFLIPLLAFAGSQLVLYTVWGRLPVFSGEGNVFLHTSSNILTFFLDTVRFSTIQQKISLVELCYLAFFTASVLHALGSSKAQSHEKLSWVLYLLLGLSLSGAVWIEDTAFLRALSEFCLFGFIILIGSDSKVKIPVIVSTGVFWILLFLDVLLTGTPIGGGLRAIF